MVAVGVADQYLGSAAAEACALHLPHQIGLIAPGHDEIAVVALEVESYARRGECASLRPRVAQLGERSRAITDAGDASDARALVQALNAAVGALCP